MPFLVMAVIAFCIFAGSFENEYLTSSELCNAMAAHMLPSNITMNVENGYATFVVGTNFTWSDGTIFVIQNDTFSGSRFKLSEFQTGNEIAYEVDGEPPSLWYANDIFDEQGNYLGARVFRIEIAGFINSNVADNEKYQQLHPFVVHVDSCHWVNDNGDVIE